MTYWLSVIYIVCTALLVIVGAFGVRYAIKTLRAVEGQQRAMQEQLAAMKSAGQQTDSLIAQATEQVGALRIAASAAETNAGAAKASADALINSERAWIVAEVEPSTAIASGQGPLVMILIKNRGKTVARVIEKGENFSIHPTAENLQETPDYGKSIKWPDGIIFASVFRYHSH